MFIHKQNQNLITNLSGNWAIKIKISNIEIKETKNLNTFLIYQVALEKRNIIEKIENEDINFLCALYRSLIKHFSKKYITLNYIELIDYEIKQRQNGNYITSLIIGNGNGKKFIFSQEMKNKNLSITKTITETVQFFANAEIAAIRTALSLKDAKKRNRFDLIDKYIIQLSNIVEINNYEILFKAINERK